MKLGQPVVEEAGKSLGKKLGEGTWNKAKQIWEKVFPKVNEKPLAKGAAEALAEDTQDEEALDTLTKQLKKLLEADPDLAQQLHKLVAEDEEMISKAVNITQNVRGDKNIVIGQSSGGSFNIS
ncbi:hypothetical protein AM10699_67100 (plasmid) [Acaryochloris marina MBIC10699]|nr:hypothetical protein AM10699_67100 [Acaryochloris marina MBIC10699]